MKKILDLINRNFHGKVGLYQRREGVYQLIIPIFHEDGDMVDVYLSESDGRIRISDYGLTLMRLSYIHEINSPVREQIFDNILANNGISDDRGNLYLDSSEDLIYQNIMQFIGGIQKIINMRMWNTQRVNSLFFPKLEDFVDTKLKRFCPEKSVTPLESYPVIEVDYAFMFSKKPFYLFGVNNKDKARNSAIALLELQKANLNFFGMVVHEDFETLPKRERIYLTQNADKQFPTLDNFEQSCESTLDRFAA